VPAEIVRAPLHQRRGERHGERAGERRQILEEDLFLKILGSRGYEDALTAEDCRDQIGERLSGTGAGLAQQRAAVLDDVGHGGGHPPLAVARLVPVHDTRQRPGLGEGGGDPVA
jgi:hypothetical protein